MAAGAAWGYGVTVRAMAHNEGRHFPCDGGDDEGRLLAGSHEAAAAGEKPDLRLPGDVAHVPGHRLEPLHVHGTDGRVAAAGPCAFSQHPARVIDGVAVCLQHDLMRRVFEAQVRQPDLVLLRAVATRL